MLGTVLVAALTASGVMAEEMVTGAVGRRVDMAERQLERERDMQHE